MKQKTIGLWARYYGLPAIQKVLKKIGHVPRCGAEGAADCKCFCEEAALLEAAIEMLPAAVEETWVSPR